MRSLQAPGDLHTGEGRVTHEQVRAWRDVVRKFDEPLSFEDWRFLVALCDEWEAQRKVIEEVQELVNAAELHLAAALDGLEKS